MPHSTFHPPYSKLSSIDQIKELRERTGLSFNQIKKALDEAGGDDEKAVNILAEQGAVVAAKKASRSTKAGIVEAYIHATKTTASMVELLCETDFVARNPLFSELAHEIAMHIAAMNPVDNKELLEQPFIKDASTTVKSLIDSYIAKLGENIQIGNFVRYQI